MNIEIKNEMINKGLGFLDELYGLGFYEKLKKQENFAMVSNAFSSCIENELFTLIEELEKKIEKEANTGSVNITFNSNDIVISRNLVTAKIYKRKDKTGKEELRCLADNTINISLNNNLYDIRLSGALTKSGKSLGISLKNKKNNNSELSIKRIFQEYIIDKTIKNLMPEAELLRLLVKVIIKSEERGVEFLNDLKGKKDERFFDSKLKDFLEVEMLYEKSNKEIIDYNKNLKKIERRKIKEEKLKINKES